MGPIQAVALTDSIKVLARMGQDRAAGLVASGGDLHLADSHGATPTTGRGARQTATTTSPQTVAPGQGGVTLLAITRRPEHPEAGTTIQQALARRARWHAAVPAGPR